MATEIERKFRLTRFDRRVLGDGIRIQQGYLCFDPEIRVRMKGTKGFLTIKTRPATVGSSLVRTEFEYSIPSNDAQVLLELSRARIEKVRYQSGAFEIDVFAGRLAGLVLLEVESAQCDQDVVLPPGFAGVEVTADPRFLNQRLATISSIAELE